MLHLGQDLVVRHEIMRIDTGGMLKEEDTFECVHCASVSVVTSQHIRNIIFLLNFKNLC